MSIRYTIRHNIPSISLSEEDVNDSSTWDLNLLRKHELAETDNHDIVYRQHDGKVVNWTEAATQQANDILEQVQDLSARIDNQADVVQQALQTVQEQAATLTEEAETAAELAHDSLVKADLAVTESQENATSARDSATLAQSWAVKMDGLVSNQDYSSKYYAQQSESSAQSASTSASQAQQAATTSAEQAAQNAVEDVSDLLSGYVTSAQTSASTATTKAEEASESASDALQAKGDAENSADLSRDWAIKMDDKVSNEDYSSKYYAGQAQGAAQTAATQAASEVRTQLAQYVTDTTDAADRAEQALDEIDTIIEGGVYVPVTGGTINGDLTVTGTITGVEWEDVTGRPTAMTASEASTGTETTVRTISAKVLSDLIDDRTATFLPLTGGTLTGNVYTTPYYDGTIVDPEGGQTLIVSKGKVAKGTAPSEAEWHTMVMAVDNSGSTNNANKYGQVETGVMTDGSVETAVQVYKNEANSTTSAKISVGYDANGNVFTSAPTPTAGDNSTKIATTAFVNTKAGNYLPLAGGTMTGTLYNSQNDFFTISKTDGVLNQGVRIWGGYGYSGGASLYLYGKNHSSAGDFSLCAHDGTNAKALAGHADGTLTWAGKNVERVNASGTNYIRYESGLQICWGDLAVTGSAVSDATATLPQAFKSSTSYNIVTGRFWAYSKDENYIIKSMTATNFVWSTIGTVTTNSHSYRYIAIGFWK